jgi:hypothetical protein
MSRHPTPLDVLKQQPRRRRSGGAGRHGLEPLERRCLLDAVILGGWLRVTGVTENDEM